MQKLIDYVSNKNVGLVTTNNRVYIDYINAFNKQHRNITVGNLNDVYELLVTETDDVEDQQFIAQFSCKSEDELLKVIDCILHCLN